MRRLGRDASLRVHSCTAGCKSPVRVFEQRPAFCGGNWSRYCKSEGLTPEWLQVLAIVSLLTAGCCSGAIVFDILRGNRQKMWIMDVVWPVTALWSGPIGLWAYYRFGNAGKEKPYPQVVAVAATHCGAGCTLGDIIAEWIHFFAPLTIAGVAIFGAWAIDFAFAFALGIAFQYFTIAPMRNLSLGEGLVQALKADTLSLTAWQVGMYGWMAIVRFAIFGKDIPKTNPSFWFLMQIGMFAGFLTSYPVNWWLVKKGVKERM